jgi:hypothetical protein
MDQSQSNKTHLSDAVVLESLANTGETSAIIGALPTVVLEAILAQIIPHVFNALPLEQIAPTIVRALQSSSNARWTVLPAALQILPPDLVPQVVTAVLKSLPADSLAEAAPTILRAVPTRLIPSVLPAALEALSEDLAPLVVTAVLTALPAESLPDIAPSVLRAVSRPRLARLQLLGLRP